MNELKEERLAMNSITESTYSDTVVRQFTLMTVVWGVVGMLVGLIIAAQLAWPELNFGISWLSYGRLRPLHTNAVIFAFGGCALFATSYYVVQRTGQTRLFAPGLAAFTFWGWQAVIVVRHRLLRHHRQTQSQPHLCGQLVLWRIYSDRGCAAFGQQRCDACGMDEIVFSLCRCARRHGAVVVRP